MPRISASTLRLFESDLWKDQRSLGTELVGGTRCLRKRASDLQEAKVEASVLRRLLSTQGVHVPVLVRRRGQDLSIEYFEGIRLFNLLVYLDRAGDTCSHAPAVARRLVAEASARQAAIQRALQRWANGRTLPAYPAGQKVERALRVLEEPLELDIEWGRLSSELARLDQMWTPYAVVPFRDAAPKNMILAATELGLTDGGESERQRLIEDSLSRHLEPPWLAADVIDIDFASCGELTTPEDDFISLHHHERTWIGFPRSDENLTWGWEHNAERTGLTFIIRYMRFGARKAAYRLLHPTGHRMRFMYDSDLFYFERLPHILDVVWPESGRFFPYLRSVLDVLPRVLRRARADSDAFREFSVSGQRAYYTDVFPR